mmetsp:Transcript_60942/g.180422  ORF Transcript_60942/g.180422 Transcript_60942/m.180422 type:complete len:96 (-) Transcript_60942:81-368(-)
MEAASSAAGEVDQSPSRSVDDEAGTADVLGRVSERIRPEQFAPVAAEAAEVTSPRVDESFFHSGDTPKMAEESARRSVHNVFKHKEQDGGGNDKR